tara:strand:+ start:1517 stop:2071 length:555 start_codon:yes stop_codon:yes gene_type:complete
MSYIIAIDVGIKNLGLCIFDFRTAKVVEWDNVSLVPSGRYVPSNNVKYIREFVRKYERYFEDVFQVVIERQMRCNMRIVESVLHALYYDQCIIVSARSVKLHYDLSTKNYRMNKQKAVNWAQEFVLRNPQAFLDDLVQRCFTSAKKQDDLADSLLLVMYYLDTYSNQLTMDAATDLVLDGLLQG